MMAKTIGNRTSDLRFSLSASSCFLESTIRMITTDEAMLKRKIAYTPIMIRSANVKYPVGGIPLNNDKWKVVAASKVVTVKAVRCEKFCGDMKNDNSEIAVMMATGKTVLMNAEMKGLLKVRLKTNLEYVVS